MPAPRIRTRLPTPIFAGQSPGRGESGLAAGGGGRLPDGGGAADDDPQLATVVDIPIASMDLSMTDPPTALPSPARNSRRAIFDAMSLSPSGLPVFDLHRVDKFR